MSKKNKKQKTKSLEKTENLEDKIIKSSKRTFVHGIALTVISTFLGIYIGMNIRSDEKGETQQPAQKTRFETILSETKRKPESPYLYNYLGMMYLHRKEYKKAEEAFTRAIELEPYYDTAYYSLANLKFELGQYDEAIYLVTKIKQLRDGVTHLDLLKCYLHWAAQLLEQDKPKEAQKRLEIFFTLMPKTEKLTKGAALYLKIAEHYVEKEQYDEVVKVNKRVLELIPSKYTDLRGVVHANIGVAYASIAEANNMSPYYTELAESSFKKAQKIAPESKKVKSMYKMYRTLLEKKIETNDK